MKDRQKANIVTNNNASSQHLNEERPINTDSKLIRITYRKVEKGADTKKEIVIQNYRGWIVIALAILILITILGVFWLKNI